MNDKQLTQIQSWLEGDRRYKLLDCEQTAILQLRGAMLQVWLACYMCENDQQESWLGIKGLMKLTGLSNRAVIDARNDLKAIGALNETGHTANLKYTNPLQGAYTVQVTSVDNPFKGEHSSLSEFGSLPSRKRREHSSHAKCSLPSEQCSHKGSITCSGSCSLSGSASKSESMYTSATMTDTPASGMLSAEGEPSVHPPSEAKQATAKATTKTKTSASSVKWMSKYDEPKPVEFDSWSQSARSIWTEAHRLKPGVQPHGLSSPVPVERTPPNTPPPPTSGKAGDGKFHCPACEYANQYGYKVAMHIEENHPELGQQMFRLECPAGDSSCHWAVSWTRQDDNKAKRDEEVLVHLEKQHNPNSPDYDPMMDACPKCGSVYVRLNSHQCKQGG